MAQAQQYKCPNCGGYVEFDSSTQTLRCPYCDTEFDLDALREEEDEQACQPEENLTWDSRMGGQWQSGEEESMQVYLCDSCGGELVCDANTAATRCPFCDSPVVLTGRLSGTLRPDYVIPFKLDKEAAKRALRQHISGKKLVPKLFHAQNRIESIQGVYVPFWLFDADANADMRYRATRVRTWSDSNYNYTQTSFYSIVRAGSVSFERVPVDGSSRMPNALMESIEPYHFEEAVDFQTAYLSGYLADKYDVTQQESIQRANERITSSTCSVFADTVRGYATVTPQTQSIRLQNTHAKYALYPVWLLNTKWQDKTYAFAMNAQTGKFVGDLPVDTAAAWRWRIGLAVGVGAGFYLLVFVLHLFGLV